MRASNIEIKKLEQLPIDTIQPLVLESQGQGFKFLDWLVQDYLDDTNRFSLPGEALFGVYHDQELIAVGGLNRDPYLGSDAAGRVRRVYVLASWRRKGVGKQLVQRIIEEAKGHFRLLTLRTLDESASQFYCATGFQMEPEIQGATHHLVLSK